VSIGTKRLKLERTSADRANWQLALSGWEVGTLALSVRSESVLDLV